MNLIDREQKTINYYDNNAEAWIVSRGGNLELSYWQREMAKFHEFLPHGKILEIGAGFGKDAAALISMEYEYTGIDASRGMLKHAKKRNPYVKFYHMNVYDLDFSRNTFDGFWTAATLLHIPKDRIGSALLEIKRVTKPAGIGFISMKKGIGEREDPDNGRWFSYYEKSEFSDLLKRNGFTIIKSGEKHGEKDTWLIYFVKN